AFAVGLHTLDKAVLHGLSDEERQHQDQPDANDCLAADLPRSAPAQKRDSFRTPTPLGSPRFPLRPDLPR
ncbi:MAG: hypothetical protein ACK5CF_02595, partial [Opitutaceae bacterium]